MSEEGEALLALAKIVGELDRRLETKLVEAENTIASLVKRINHLEDAVYDND